MEFLNYIRESFGELKTNVTWLSRVEIQKSTVVVATFTVIFALVIFFIDKIFQTSLTGFFEIF